ncbi:MAG: hypothetical protein M0D55_14085 [Elusimicrobiota bacterium]|nr:MAG: hypothetical protein M0D55_14085 [Elusimicrobiota bacterium]
MKGFARRQLANANSLSRRGATASKGETASYDAGSAFDNNQGAGNVISGPGIGAGGGPNSGGADGSVNPGSPSGPTGNPPVTDCGANNYQTADGGCAPIPTKNMKKDTKWDWLYQTASALMMALTLLAGIALMSNALNALFATGEAIKAAVRVAMGIIGGILMALGAMMIAMTGDKIAGGIVAAVGTWTLAMAIWTPELTTGSAMKEVALKIFVPTIVGGFASAMAKKPAAAGQ